MAKEYCLYSTATLYFSAFIKDNICFYETNTTDEEVERVMNEVGLRSLVTSLPNGMYERIGEGGRMLSGGQEQRVAMARALLSKSHYFIRRAYGTS